jgi:hypothetical protein
MQGEQYQVRIPQSTVDDPIGAIVDGLTIIHNWGGIPAVEKALESVLDVVYADRGTDDPHPSRGRHRQE